MFNRDWFHDEHLWVDSVKYLAWPPPDIIQLGVRNVHCIQHVIPSRNVRDTCKVRFLSVCVRFGTSHRVREVPVLLKEPRHVVYGILEYC